MTADDEWLERLGEAWARGGRLIDLAAVEAWVRGRMARWASLGLHADLHPPTTDRSKNSLWVDLEGLGALSRITVWDSGEWEIQRGEIESGALEVSPYRPVSSIDELIVAVEAELRRMRILVGNE